VPKYCTDEQIIEAWEKLGTAKKVSDALDLDIRQVYFRRRKIEARLGISLASRSTRNRAGPNIVKAKAQDALAAARAEKYEREMIETVRNGTIIVASDCHYWPGMVSPAHEAMLRLIKALKPDIVVLNGDILDGARISRHARIMWEKQPTLKDELHAVQDRCAEIERAAGRARLVRTIGNHDARFENYWSANTPEGEDMPGMTPAGRCTSTPTPTAGPSSATARCRAASTPPTTRPCAPAPTTCTATCTSSASPPGATTVGAATASTPAPSPRSTARSSTTPRRPRTTGRRASLS